MNKIWLLSGAAALSLLASPAVAEDDLPAYGDLYNVEWCPCNPEEPFDADGSVVLGKTVMCPCDGLYSGYKKGFDEDIRDIKNAVRIIRRTYGTDALVPADKAGENRAYAGLDDIMNFFIRGEKQ